MWFVLELVCAAGVSAALYAVAVAIAPAGTPFLLLVPLPGLIITTRASAAWCGLWFVLTTAAVATTLGWEAAGGFVLPLGLPALALAGGIQRRWSLERTFLIGIAAWCLGIAGVLVLAYGDVAGIVTTAREQLMHSVDVALSTYRSIGAVDDVSKLAAERDVLVQTLLDVLPAVAVLTGSLTILFNLLLLRRWTDRSRDVDLRLWRTPDALIWALIATGFGIFVSPPALALISKNVFIVILGCYFCQGLAIVSYYLERFRLPRAIRIAGYVLIGVQHVIAALVLALGVFDLWGNFRRLSAGPADLPFHTDGE